VNEYVLGTEAVLDLEDIWEYIATDNADAADRWIAKLLDAFEDIARRPGIGHRREDLTDYTVLFREVAPLALRRTPTSRPIHSHRR
jgi:plasmid stabilization system protein ParE